MVRNAGPGKCSGKCSTKRSAQGSRFLCIAIGMFPITNSKSACCLCSDNCLKRGSPSMSVRSGTRARSGSVCAAGGAVCADSGPALNTVSPATTTPSARLASRFAARHAVDNRSTGWSARAGRATRPECKAHRHRRQAESRNRNQGAAPPICGPPSTGCCRSHSTSST
jgi:hypothetical protein